MAGNPYAAPKAQLADVAHEAAESEFIEAGQSVSAGRGWSWVTEAWQLFKAQPGGWLLMFIVAGLIFILISLIPVAGHFLPSVVMPVLGAGIMLSAHQLTGGEPVTLGKLFAGFSHRFGSLLMLGAFAFLCGFAMLMIGAGVGGLSLGVFLGTTPPDIGNLTGFWIAILVILALSVPLYMAMWFSTGLVMLNEFSVSHAITTSFVACLKNVLPFLVYGLVLFMLFVIASIPFGLGMIIAIPIAALTAYTSYRDVFYME